MFTSTPVAAAAAANASPLHHHHSNSIRRNIEQPISVLAFDIETSGPLVGHHCLFAIGAAVVALHPDGREQIIDTFSIHATDTDIRDSMPAGFFTVTDKQLRSIVFDEDTGQSLYTHPSQFHDTTYKEFWTRPKQLAQLRKYLQSAHTSSDAVRLFDEWLQRVATLQYHSPFLITDNASYDPAWLNHLLQVDGRPTIEQHFHVSRRKIIDVQNFFSGLDFLYTRSFRPRQQRLGERIQLMGLEEHDPCADAIAIASLFLETIHSVRLATAPLTTLPHYVGQFSASTGGASFYTFPSHHHHQQHTPPPPAQPPSSRIHHQQQQQPMSASAMSFVPQSGFGTVVTGSTHAIQPPPHVPASASTSTPISIPVTSASAPPSVPTTPRKKTTSSSATTTHVMTRWSKASPPSKRVSSHVFLPTPPPGPLPPGIGTSTRRSHPSSVDHNTTGTPQQQQQSRHYRGKSHLY